MENFPFSFYTSVLYYLKWLIIKIFLSRVYHFIINEWIKKKLVKIFELWNSLLGNWYKTDDWSRNVYIVSLHLSLPLMCPVDLLFTWMWLLSTYTPCTSCVVNIYCTDSQLICCNWFLQPIDESVLENKKGAPRVSMEWFSVKYINYICSIYTSPAKEADNKILDKYRCEIKEKIFLYFRLNHHYFISPKHIYPCFLS